MTFEAVISAVCGKRLLVFTVIIGHMTNFMLVDRGLGGKAGGETGAHLQGFLL